MDRAQREASVPGGDIRSEIMRAAAQLFAQRGCDISMRELAREIGYSATTIYLHFSNKDELLFAVAERALDVFDQALRRARAQHKKPEQRLRALAGAYLEFALAHPKPYLLMFVNRPAFLMSAASGDAALRVQVFDVLAETVADCLDQTATTERIHQAADAVWSTLHGVVMLHLTTPVIFDEARARAAMHSAIEMAIQACAESRPT